MKTKLISGINHVTLSVADLDKAFDFYRDVLGLTPLAKQKQKSAYFLAGNDWIALVQSESQTTSPLSYAHLALSVLPGEFALMAKRIRDSGSTIWQENSSPGESLYFLDPSGNRLEIHSGDWKSRLRWLHESPSEGLTLFQEKESYQ